MIVLKFLLLVIAFFIYLCKVLEFIYRFQIKEFRFDRMWSSMKEEGIGIVLYHPRLIFPAKKLRNIGIVAVIFIAALCYIYISYSFPVWVLALYIVFAPLFAFLDVCFMVALTSIPVYLYREYIIGKARQHFTTSPAKVIMITGSYGKSSVKEYIYALLKDHFHVAKTDANMNTDIGVALNILKHVKKNTEYFIVEAGAYRVGEIAKICSIVRPDYVVVTAFGNQHLDLYGSKTNLVKAESEPLRFLTTLGIVFINKDIPEYSSLIKGARFQHISYSLEHKVANIHATSVKTTGEGSAATIHADFNEVKESLSIETKLLGRHIVQNLLPAVGIALQLDVSPKKIISSIRHLEPVKHKLSLHNGPKGCTVVSDSANSNVEGFIEAIGILDLYKSKKKIIVSKGVIELGVEKRSSYKRIIKALEETDVRLFTTDPLFAEIAKHQVVLFDDEEKIAIELEKDLTPDTVLLLEGKFTPGFVTRYAR